ncbi:sigma-70 family RNA polymerase sigma factor [Roseiconus nitratireducens]|uniref:Sigma-70 family RNA polymerase sigma factor n=1 Tax=Roseiconus nitratireducens TaxID=2605748 RepID=A0A5M6CXC7_9BACT|nr:sigma-70 family RNA polymerase sigma factor [Roseiconus nitratireducens]KAA5539586.1 sigma-70 family RNA polymerase sigma factor [Roseiconus nitratireducens]
MLEQADPLLDQALQGDNQVLGDLLMRHHDRLVRVVSFRMDPRIRGRVDPADVVQETFLEAMTRFADYRRDPKMPFFLWLRFLTVQKLCLFHRRHLGVLARDVSRDVSVFSGPSPEVSSAVLAAHLIGKLTTPSQAAIRAETQSQLEDALNLMEPIDREVIALRHFEWLTNQETAQVLHLTESAASNRYVRAVKRLKVILDTSG